jgi:hypothetical protein
MSIDTSKAGQQIAKQMEAIEKDFEDKDGFKLGAIITIVGIDGPEGGSHFRIRHNVGNPALALGVMRLAEDQWIQFMRQGPGDQD